MNKIKYKSFCWSLGTTSFRTVDFNMRIERQLALLDRFWALPENAGEAWSKNRPLQYDYYRFMQEQNFVDGNAPRPDKDAREKTSGLFSIGLIDEERRLTSAGQTLLKISQDKDFISDNRLQIPKDSFIYLKQLLKTHIDVGSNIIRPYVITVYALSKLDYLTRDEFTYLLPLCTNRENTEAVINAILELRGGAATIDEIIVSRLMGMDNYKAALNFFLKYDITESVICKIGMNRKSGGTGKQAYDKPYYHFFELLRNVALEKDSESVLPLYGQCGKIKNKPNAFWRQYLFNNVSRKKLKNDGLSTLNDVPILHISDEQELRKIFFEQLHLFKAKATLSDYADLNMRYLKTTDTVIFADNRVILDTLPKCWLDSIVNSLLSIAFTPSERLTEDIDLGEIAPFLEINADNLYAELERIYGVKITTVAEATAIVADERYKRFNTLIDELFKKISLIDILSMFERREDDKIRGFITDNADIPTIFEYIIGIAWYLISGRKGDVLNYMNLSLEADLLPRTHASGGNADIEYHYEQTADYPAHCLLIEVTLSDKNNQRRMEMEPVSRHLGDYILNSGNKSAYAVFISTTLYHNVISDFRNRMTYQYYSEEYKEHVDGLKILPLEIGEIKTILKKDIGYAQIYALLEEAYHSNEPIPTWYDKEIKNRL